MMPNWTSNKLEIFGSKEEVARFVEHVGQNMDFEKIIPPPANMFRENLGEEEKRECKKKGIPDWYEWQCENWGTKWNAKQDKPVEVWETPDLMVATYEFDTAWATPEPVIRRIIKDWPELEVTGGWIDEGYEGCGSFQQFWE